MRYRPITRNREFGRVYARGRSYVHPKLVLYVNKNRLGHTRVGLTATKKVGGAVQRNRARRVMRAALYETCPTTWAAGTWCSWPGAKRPAAKAARWQRPPGSFCIARVWWNDRPAAGGAHPLL